MSKGVVLLARKDGSTSVWSVPGTKKPEPREPATWIASRFKNFTPRFKFGRHTREVHLQRVEWWNDTQEWVGVYFATVQVVGTRKQWTERYVFAYRNGDMVCFRQFGTKDGWRALA